MELSFHQRRGLLTPSVASQNPQAPWLATLAPGRGEGVRYHFNLVGHPGCGILDGGAQLVSDGLLQLLTLRSFLPNQGGVVLSFAQREAGAELYRYGLERGLTTKRALKTGALGGGPLPGLLF